MKKRYVSPSDKNIKKDVDAILWAFRLEKIRRYIHQRYFLKETLDATYADKIETGLRLETVAEHSWKVADTVMLLSPYFSYLDSSRCLKLAILHDKMEILAGDPSPVGRDGTGEKAHAFNSEKAYQKDLKERTAIDSYLNMLRPDIRAEQYSILNEMLECESLESRFVKAIDKLEATAFILLRKNGNIEDKHIDFLIKFHEKNWNYFPPLKGYYDELIERILISVTRFRGITKKQLIISLQSYQSDLITMLNSKDINHWQDIIEEQHIYKKGTKKYRLQLLFTKLDETPSAYSSLDAFRQISQHLNNIEDDFLGVDSWNPPRFYPPNSQTNRLYPTSPDSMFPVNGYNGVEALISISEITFISRYGAIEIQIKQDNDKEGTNILYNQREKFVIYKKPDCQGDGVWHSKNIS